jgi:capsular exopolysaccharide synthesis family protein
MTDRIGPGPRTPRHREETSLRDIGRILRRNRWYGLGALALTLAVAALATLLATPVYESEATLRIQTKDPRDDLLSRLPSAIGGLSLPGLDGGSDVETEIGVLGSRQIAEAVADSLNLHVALLDPTGRPRERTLLVHDAPRDAAVATFVLSRLEGGSYAVRVRDARGRAEVPARVEPGRPYHFGDVVVSLHPSLAADGPAEIRFAVRSFPRTLDTFREQLRIAKQEGRSSLVVVRYRSADAPLAAEVVNAVVDRFAEYQMQTSKTASRSMVAVLQAQIADYEVQLRDAEERLRRYREAEMVVSPQDQAREQVRNLSEVEGSRTQMVIARDALTRVLQSADRAAAAGEGTAAYRRLATFPALLQQDAVQEILKSLNVLEEGRSTLMLRRTSGDAEVRRVEERIRELETQLRDLARNYVAGLDTQLGSVDAAIAGYGADLGRIPAREVEFTRLAREQALLTEVYTTLQARLKEAEVQEAIDPGVVRVVDRAVVAHRPAAPRPAVNLVLAAVLGSLLGLSVVMTREIVDTRVRTVRDAELAAGGLPVLAAVPHAGGARRGRLRRTLGEGARALRRSSATPARALATRDAPRLPEAEAYRTLRTQLTLTGQPAASVVAIVSPATAEGRSTCAANLAVAIAQLGRRVVLVDADFRAGVLDRMLGVAPEPGLAQVLADIAGLDESIRTVGLNGAGSALDVLPAGATVASATELLAGGRLPAVLEELCGRYDVVVVDTPPLGAVADGAVIAAHVDRILMVARAGTTDRRELEQAVSMLQRLDAPLVGLVLNGVEPGTAGQYA